MLNSHHTSANKYKVSFYLKSKDKEVRIIKSILKKKIKVVVVKPGKACWEQIGLEQIVKVKVSWENEFEII